MLETFPLTWHFSIEYHDIDMMLHANHAAYIRWAESLRAEYFAQVMRSEINGAKGMILASLQFNYERPLDYREKVAIGCKASRVGNKSFDFYYEIWSESHDARAATGTTTMVAFDYAANESITVPPEWRDGIARYAKGAHHTLR